MKRTLNDLAIFGGPSAFEDRLHVGRPNVGDRQRLSERIDDSLDRRWLTNDGPHVQEFERRVEEYVDARYCVAVCSGTVALEIAISAAALSGEVIIPSFTFIATAHALQWQGVTPIFCDINPRTHNLDSRRVEEMITSRTTGIIGVHLWGRPCDVEALAETADRHDLQLLFDAAHAFGCSHRGQMIGNFGNAEVFSFHATKVLNTFEGGAIVTNDHELATKARLMRNFGFADYDSVTQIGTNGKLNEVSAAMGLTSLESLDAFVAANRQNYDHYCLKLTDIPGIDFIQYDTKQSCTYQYVVLEVDDVTFGVNRDDLQRILWAENVLARRYFYPGCHRMEPYRSYFPDAGRSLPNTERLVTQVLSLPTGAAVGSNEIDEICQIIRLVASQGGEIKERLSYEAREDSVRLKKG